MGCESGVDGLVKDQSRPKSVLEVIIKVLGLGFRREDGWEIPSAEYGDLDRKIWELRSGIWISKDG